MAAPQKNDPETGVKNQTASLEPDSGLALIRRQIETLASRGDYRGCGAMIESNLRALYEKERWPDDFFSVLKTYQRCYPSLGVNETFEERLTELLKSNGVPFVFVNLLRGSGSSIVWSGGYFKDLAVFCESRDDLETALSYSDLAIKTDPSNPAAHVVRGWVLDDMGMPDEAEEMYRRALELNESNHIAAHSLAKHLTDKDPESALEYVDKAVGIAPSEGLYYATKAKILLRLDDRKGALDCCDLAMSCSPYAADYPYQKGEVLLADGREMAAIAQFRKAMALDEKHLPSLWRLAALYQESQPELALTYANTIASLEPENPEAGLLRGTILSMLDDEAEAASQFRQLIEADPKYHGALGGYADLLLHDDPASAIDYYTQAISLAPENARYHTGRGRAYEELGRTAQAIKEYREAVSLDKTDVRAFERLGRLLAEQNPREALGYFAKAAELAPDNAFYHSSKGEILMRLPNGKNEAIACFNAALGLEPGNARLHVLLARLLEETGNPASAAEHYRRATGIGTDDPEAFYRLACLTLSSEPGVALLHINSAIALDKNNGEYYCFKAKALNILGHDRHALGQLLESLRADGKNAEALREVSELAKDGSPQEALAYINRAVKISPNNPDYLCTKANLLLSLGETKKAFAEYRSALKLDAKHHESLFGCGRCLAAGNDIKALEYFDKAIAQNKGVSAYHAEKAAFLSGLGRTDEALTAYDEAVALNDKNLEYTLAKAKLLDQSGDASGAAENYRRVLEIDPDCPDAVGRLGVLLAEESPSEALLYLNHAIEIFPNEYLYHAWRGRALLSLGDSGGAAVEYQQAVRLGGESAQTYYTLAQILREKLPETALGYCLRAIEKNNANAGYRLLCGKIYLALGQTGNAIDMFEHAAGLDPSFHEASEKAAEILYTRKSPDVLEAVDKALESEPRCASCLLLKAKILDEKGGTDEAVACLDRALKSSPEYIPAREELVLLLQKKRAFVRLQLEKRRLEKQKRLSDVNT